MPHTSRDFTSVAFLQLINIKLCLRLKMRYRQNMMILEVCVNLECNKCGITIGQDGVINAIMSV